MSLDRFISKWVHPDHSPKPISEGELAAVEARFDFRFPSDYRDGVLRFGLASPTIALLDAIVDGGLDIADLSQLLAPHEMIDSTEGWREMGLPTDMVAFATDCCGNLFCFRTDGSSAIHYFDHDFGTTETIAASFTGWIDEYCAIAPSDQN